MLGGVAAMIAVASAGFGTYELILNNGFPDHSEGDRVDAQIFNLHSSQNAFDASVASAKAEGIQFDPGFVRQTDLKFEAEIGHQHTLFPHNYNFGLEKGTTLGSAAIAASVFGFGAYRGARKFSRYIRSLS